MTAMGTGLRGRTTSTVGAVAARANKGTDWDMEAAALFGAEVISVVVRIGVAAGANHARTNALIQTCAIAEAKHPVIVPAPVW
jgi:hypothetical protein